MADSIGLYLHTPFCKSKCPYCDFYSFKASVNDFDEYVNALITKINLWGKKLNRKVTSVYFGGGTPSVLEDVRLCRVLSAVKKSFDVDTNAEITLEINPESGKALDFSSLYNCGFNRLSMGLQSADENELRMLGRIHTTDDIKISVERARSAGFKNISLDLMMGLPNQSFESLEKSIKFCADLGVEHISSYILKIEEGTRFFDIKNELALPDEDEQAQLYLNAVELLGSLGYEQYEISNFAKSGFESRHNVNYWRCGEYLGIGSSAHSFLDGKRFYYGRSVEDFYNDKIISDGNGGDEEEFIMLSLRLKSGLSFDEYRKRFKKDVPQSLTKKAEIYSKAGYAEINAEKICFTPKGFLVSNAIISELI